MKPRHSYGVVAAWCVALSVLVPGICAQEATVLRHTGVPHDWSQSHILFSRDALARHPELILREPRIQQQLMQRRQAANWGAYHGDAISIHHHNPPNPRLQRDWSVNPLGGRLRPDIFPAKYSFDPNAAPDCTNDYVVFGLGVAGVNNGAANLVAFNNLYVNDTGTGFCAGLTAPTVLFAYNVTTIPTGRILTSPVLSLDGTQIAFVESVPGSSPSATFHVLTWTAGQGTIGGAVTPTSAQMTSLTFAPASNSTMSSPWVDYASDTAYMGAGNGILYQITPVFNGTPGLGGPPFPVTVSSPYNLTAPVLDSARGLVMVGSLSGDLYSVDITTGAVVPLVVGVAGGTSSGIIAPPIVDVTNGTTFVVSGNNGTSAVLVQTETSTLLPTGTVIAPIGEGGFGGTIVHMYQPAFSNNYFNDPSTGVVTLCGTGISDTRPWQYTFGFTGATLNPIPASSQQLSTSATDRCSGWTEFFNPYAGATDTITATSVASNVLTVTANNSDIAVGQEVYMQGTAESFLNGRGVIVTSLIGSGPSTGFTANLSVPDYTNASDTGAVSTGTDFFFFGLTQDCTFLGGTSTNGCVVAIGNNDGTTTTTTAQVTGGPSGIIVDNFSTAAQASSIYFTALSTNSAFKFTQEGLQ